MKQLIVACLVFFGVLADSAAQTGLPIPRFVSVRAEEANLRTGPGVRYPIAWVYLKPGLPFEIIAEFDTWRMVRDQAGIEGWLHQSLLTGQRTGVVVVPMANLRRNPEEISPTVARAKQGVIVEIDACEGNWCAIEAGGFSGWVPRGSVWGTYAGENFD